MRNMIMLIPLIILITLAGCGGGHVARAHDPVWRTELTSDEYNEAEAHFAGTELAALPPEWKGGYTDRECQELLDKMEGISYVLMGLGVLTGGSGLSAVIPKDMEQEKKEALEITFGSLTLAFGVADAVLVGVFKTLSTRYGKNCVTETDAEDLPPPPAAEVETEASDAGVEGP
ncbi:MAG: hypothetical protein WC406_08430 [Methanoregula sp.]|jgi:hypothetical protein